MLHKTANWGLLIINLCELRTWKPAKLVWQVMGRYVMLRMMRYIHKFWIDTTAVTEGLGFWWAQSQLVKSRAVSLMEFMMESNTGRREWL